MHGTYMPVFTVSNTSPESLIPIGNLGPQGKIQSEEYIFENGDELNSCMNTWADDLHFLPKPENIKFQILQKQ
ncbi:MAG: hypothetical protein ACI9H6_000021 [Patiriisocius sp.]|jgi:hypothetical protein